MKRKRLHRMRSLFVGAATLAVCGMVTNNAFATNGMNIEGYGPIAMGMGGASFAYDNGTAATMNNPATLGLMSEGHRVDLAIGFLGPDITTSMSGMTAADSSATAFWMPALGWASKKGNLTYGLGVFGQGGMGTEFSGSSFLAPSGQTVRSEVGVGRAMIPVAYNASEKLTIGGSVDFVWAGMDLQMDMTGAQFGDMVSALGGTQANGTASGTMVDGLVANIGTLLDPTGPVNWSRFNFSDGSDFTGEAKGYGLAGKIGLAYKVSPTFTVGAIYHSKTSLGDLKTDNATVSMNANVDTGLAAGGAATGTYAAMNIPIVGEIAVRNFQWPETYGIGVAFQPSDKVMLAVDLKQIAWSGVMKNFQMTFTADPASAQSGLGAGFGGAVLDATLFQDWEDQTVISLGGAFKATDALTLRAGYNHASNPIPDRFLNALFPAIVESHVTGGAGYAFSQNSDLNFAFSVGLEKESTNTGSSVKSSHKQISWQAMYSLKY